MRITHSTSETTRMTSEYFTDEWNSCPEILNFFALISQALEISRPYLLL